MPTRPRIALPGLPFLLLVLLAAAQARAQSGDGDRFGILDVGARMLDSCQALGLILDYLARRRGFKGAVGRTLATSRLIDAVAAEHDLELVLELCDRAVLLSDGRLYFLSAKSAIVTCVDAKSGKVHWGPERIPGMGEVYSSPVAANVTG